MERRERKLSFGAGPGLWPDEVLEAVAERMGPEPRSGLSPLEWSHRGEEYIELQARVVSRLERLLAVPETHQVLLLPGGATLQFAMVPSNLRREGQSADYLVTGHWARKAARYAELGGPVRRVASSEAEGFARIPPREQWRVDPEAAYLHLTSNNTIAGTQIRALPEDLPAPLVVDASSDVLTRELSIEGIGLLYAGAQKNLGPAGLAVVVVERSLLDRAPGNVPGMLCYREHAARESRLNTPPGALVLLMDEMLAWVEAQGGAAEMHSRAERRAALVYQALDRHGDIYRPLAAPGDRSRTNVVFRLEPPASQERFLERAEAAGLAGLAGHRSVGGLRASLYAPMPVEGARRLAEFLEEFARRPTAQSPKWIPWARGRSEE